MAPRASRKRSPSRPLPAVGVVVLASGVQLSEFLLACCCPPRHAELQLGINSIAGHAVGTKIRFPIHTCRVFAFDGAHFIRPASF